MFFTNKDHCCGSIFLYNISELLREILFIRNGILFSIFVFFGYGTIKVSPYQEFIFRDIFFAEFYILFGYFGAFDYKRLSKCFFCIWFKSNFFEFIGNKICSFSDIVDI
ncbi:Uncharacterised protein [Mycobacterium tuberculosis]|nr:Uncharacterised protein [Mycobacterium tuberculosis]